MQYLNAYNWQDSNIDLIKYLWSQLTRDSNSNLRILTAKIMSKKSIGNKNLAETLAILDDDKLSGEDCLEIFNALAGTEIFRHCELPEKLYKAYLEKINRKESKQKKNSHITQAVKQWLSNPLKKPGLSDNLIKLFIDFRSREKDETFDQKLFAEFRSKLTVQANKEMREPDNDCQYLRAKATLQLFSPNMRLKTVNS